MTVTSISSVDFGREMLTELDKLERACKIKLSRFQRLLLAEKGSVEQLLSIIAGSPITVHLTKQKKHDSQIERAVWLKDATGKRLVFAETTYDGDRLPMGVLEDLLVGQIGIGSVIMKYSIETYRRITKLGYEPEHKTLFREYEIVKDGAAIFHIKETFSIKDFLE